MHVALIAQSKSPLPVLFRMYCLRRIRIGVLPILAVAVIATPTIAGPITFGEKSIHAVYELSSARYGDSGIINEQVLTDNETATDFGISRLEISRKSSAGGVAYLGARIETREEPGIVRIIGEISAQAATGNNRSASAQATIDFQITLNVHRDALYYFAGTSDPLNNGSEWQWTPVSISHGMSTGAMQIYFAQREDDFDEDMFDYLEYPELALNHFGTSYGCICYKYFGNTTHWLTAGVHTISGQIDLSTRAADGRNEIDYGAFSLSIQAVVPEPSNFAMAAPVAIVVVASGVASRRRGEAGCMLSRA